MRISRDPAELGFSSWDRRRLSQALAQASDARVYQRLQAVLLVAQGRSIEEVAYIAGVSLRAVYDWVRRYLTAHRVEDLVDAPRTGRPVAAPRLTERRIEQELRRDPQRLGYRSTSWTIALLATRLRRRYGCTIKTRTLRRRLKQLGWRWKRPRYIYSKKDPHRAQKKGALSDA